MKIVLISALINLLFGISLVAIAFTIQGQPITNIQNLDMSHIGKDEFLCLSGKLGETPKNISSNVNALKIVGIITGFIFIINSFVLFYGIKKEKK